MFGVFQIELIDRVDDIYRNTSWDEQFKGYGVQIQQVISITLNHGGFILLTSHSFLTSVDAGLYSATMKNI